MDWTDRMQKLAHGVDQVGVEDWPSRGIRSVKGGWTQAWRKRGGDDQSLESGEEVREGWSNMAGNSQHWQCESWGIRSSRLVTSDPPKCHPLMIRGLGLGVGGKVRRRAAASESQS